MLGAYSYGLTEGKILAEGVDKYILDNGIYVSDHTMADFPCVKGDSGGPVMLKVTNSPGNYWVIGIVQSDDGITRYFSTYSNIMSELGVTCMIS